MIPRSPRTGKWEARWMAIQPALMALVALMIAGIAFIGIVNRKDVSNLVVLFGAVFALMLLNYRWNRRRPRH